MAARANAQDVPDMALTDRFREQNRAVHRQSDALVNVKLAAAMTDMRMYMQALVFFRALFVAIETALQKNAHLSTVRPMYECFCDPSTRRTERFDRDIQFFQQRLAKSEHAKGRAASVVSETLPESVIAYVTHISKLAHSPDTAYLVTAYAYTMMQAILGGGRILKKLVTTGLALDPDSDDGVAIFCLEKGQTVADVRDRLRSAINRNIGPQLNDAQRQALVAETKQVFLRNNRMVADLQTTADFLRRIIKWILLVLFLILCLYMGVSKIKAKIVEPL
ncbi:Heme oxygenase 1 [Porphyridium purpureum]|uniref:Heme oxygenase 1 n=1 Tax=Porphyridium purpureum TaxID=35688 RepID=A0A5J4Z3K0_PORPP|nr:Heme oxygenase 1 [Porphyridium purpureum]|eukprot:POR0900..scf295_1